MKFRRLLFTSAIKRYIRHLHDVVVQIKRQRKCIKKCCTCKVVVLLTKPIDVLAAVASPDLEVPIGICPLKNERCWEQILVLFNLLLYGSSPKRVAI